MAQAKNEAIAPQQKAPENERAFLTGPEGREFIAPEERLAGMVKDVVNREIVRSKGPHESKRCAGDGDEASKSSAAGGLA
jgi:hypothetical protein